MEALEPISPIPSRKKSNKWVICLTCGAGGVYTTAGPNHVPAWLCFYYPDCDSYVGVHKGTESALGTIAGPEIRVRRSAAHVWIDRLWRGRESPSRKEVYQLISHVVGMKHFHVAQCDGALLERLELRRREIEQAFHTDLVGSNSQAVSPERNSLTSRFCDLNPSPNHRSNSPI